MRGRRHRARRARRLAGPVHHRGAGLRRASRCSTPTSRSSRTSRPAPARSPASPTDQRAVVRAPRDVRALLPALLALPEPADLQGGDQLVRARDATSATAWSSSTRTSPGRRSTSRTASSASGSPTRATGRSAATATGARPSPCGCRTTRRYPRVDVYGSLAELEADFGRVPTNEAGEPDLHRPFIDELTRPNPDDPTGALDHAPHPGRARRVVRLGLDAVRPGALPVRERRLVRAPLPGRLHRRVHRPDPRLVLHAARAGHGAVRPPGVPQRPVPRHRAGRRRPQGQQVAAQLPGPGGDVGPCTAPTPCAGSSCRARSCAAATSSSARRASATASARCCCRCGARTTSSRCTRAPRTAAPGYVATPVDAARAADARADGPLRAGAHAGPRRDDHRAAGRLRHLGARARPCASTSTS